METNFTSKELHDRDNCVTIAVLPFSYLCGQRVSRATDRGMMCSRVQLSALSAAMLVAFGCRVGQPGKGESSLMNGIKHRFTVGGRNNRSPLGHGPEVVEQGKTAFGAYCVACHGLDGQNTGVPFAAQMSPPVPSLASRQVQDYTDGQLKWIIENGISPSGMPASKGILSDEEMWSIVAYLRHLPAAGSVGEPAIYTGDCNSNPAEPSSSQAQNPDHTNKRKSVR